METPLQTPEPGERKRRISPVTIVVAMVALLAMGAALWFLVAPVPSKNSALGPTAANRPMSATEQEYAKRVQIGNIAMSRAENFLHQEVTIVNGDVYNGGSESVAVLRVTLEFVDDMNQVVLRETRGVLGMPEQPLSPGERRAFEISFEHVPPSWNMQQPTVHVADLRLPPRK
jgi:hypothetical protein